MMKIVIVDDQPINLDVLKRHAGKLPETEIIAFLNPLEALQYCKTESVDLILTDYQMPEMFGTDFMTEFRSLPGKESVPIIMITAESQQELRYKALEMGANDFLNKPIDGTEFIARARNMLALRAAQNELLKKNSELEILNKKLEEVSTLKTHLMAIAANDLSDPLGSIIQFSDTMLSGRPTAEQHAQYLRIIQDLANRMNHIIREVLNSEAIESGKLIFAQRPIGLGELVKFNVGIALHRATEKKQKFLFHADQSVLVKGDEIRLQEIVNQLISNAIIYSPIGSTISVRVYSIGEIVRLEVTDEGPGISEEDMKNLFKKFQRLSAKPTGGESSNGIGLSIAKQLVELQGGKIWATSAGVGKGATFTVEFPIYHP
ncbi:MAG: response regulator [Chloroherpetonaceae bacterium]|nr:response regulator [Chloroherpetonaceae bacterium]